jgi:amino acid transporter
MPSSLPSRPTLDRAVSRGQLLGLSINDVVGSGIFVLPAVAASILGSASVLAVLLAGLAVALLVLCFAEASTYFDEPGGAYLYTREAFGEFVGFQVGWMTWLARVASIASLANGFIVVLALVWPSAESETWRAPVIIALIGVLTWVNVLGVGKGAKMAVGLVLAKTLPLVLFVLVGIFHIDWSQVAGFETLPAGGLGEAALLLLFAYAGFENTAAAAGEYKNPRRDVPFALLTMIALVTLLYVGVQLVVLGTLPGVRYESSAVAEAAGSFLGSGGLLLMTLAAVVSIGGNIGNTILVGPRYLFALAADGFGPRSLARIHPVYRTPYIAILTLSGAALLLALSGTFVQLAMLSIVARLTTYLGTAAAVPILRRKLEAPPGAFRLPGGAIIPILAILLSLAFLLSADWRNLLAGAIALAVGGIIYRHRRQVPEQ